MATTFTASIKPYFSSCYRDGMIFMFDLWSADDVKQHWDAIHDSVHSKRMPVEGCPEGVWDDTRRSSFLADFTLWKNDGFQP